jgi:uncharacterized membrane protein YsdA (DUF1294 family)
MPLIATAAVSAVSGLTSAVSGISDTQKRRIYEQNLASLNFEQKMAIEKMLREAGSEDAKQALLQQALGGLGGARIGALSAVQVEREKTKKTLWIVGAAIAGLGIIAAIIIKNKKK